MSAFPPAPPDRLSDGIRRSATTGSDTAARIFDLQQKTGLPHEVIERNLDQVAREAAAANFDPVAFRKTSPLLATWLEQHPLNASLAADDLGSLTALERTLGFAKRVAHDLPIMALNAAIAIPEAAVGGLDLAATLFFPALEQGGGGTMGRQLAAAGFQPATAKAILATYYSKAQQQAYANVNEADGLIATAVAALSNPSVIAASVIESLPQMFVGGAIGKAALGGGALAGAVGEGTMQAFSAAAQTRGDYGTLSPGQAGAAAASGVLTGAIGVWGGKLAERLGIADVDTMLAGAAVHPVAQRNLVTALLLSGVQEGFLEELPQSIQEQVWQNVADGKPLTTGVNQAAVLGVLSGAVMGGGAQGAEHILRQFGAAVKDSKTATRSPDKFEEAVKQLAKDGPTHVYAQLGPWNQYWQDKGLDPAAVAADLTGDPQAYADATEGNGTLKIPIERYATRLGATEHNAHFAKELALGPAEMNGREFAAFQKEQSAQLEKAAAVIPQEDVAAGVAAFTPEVAALHQRMLAKLEAAGHPASAAATYTTLLVAANQLNEQAQTDFLTKQYKIDIEREGLSAAATAEFVAHGPDGPLYNIVGGPQDRSTVTGAAALEALGITVPDTPADTGERLSGAEIRKRLLEAQQKLGAAPGAGVVPAEPGADVLPAGTKDRLAAAGHTREAIDAMSFADAEKALTAPAGEPAVAGGRYTAEDLARAKVHEAGMVAHARPHETRPRTAAEAADVALLAKEKASEGHQAPAAHEAGTVPIGRPGEQPGADATRMDAGRSDVGGAERGGLPYPRLGGDLFVRQPPEHTGARLTPDVTRELAHLLEEMEQLRPVPFTLVPAVNHDGNTAGGEYDRVGGAAGAQVYHDVIGYAPVNLQTSGRQKGQPARAAHGTTAHVIDAARAVLTSRDVATNIQESALRIAERRAAGDWKDLHPYNLPPSWAIVAPLAQLEDLSQAIDAAQTQTVDLLGDETGISEADLAVDVDTTFDPEEFGQPKKAAAPDLFAQFLESDTIGTARAKPYQLEGDAGWYVKNAEGSDIRLAPDQVDIDPVTGDVQARLPGDAGAVRDTNVATPQMEAPFSLTAEVATAPPGKQQTFFQGAPPLTGADVLAWRDALQAALPGLVDLDVALDPRTGDLRLDLLHVDRATQNAGTGGRAMQALTRFADQHGRRVTLSPAEAFFLGETTSSSRLMQFYQRFGFVENRGPYSNFSVHDRMYREPTAPVREFGQPLEAEPVATLTGAEFAAGETDIKVIRRAAVEYYRREFQERTITRPGFGDILFTKAGRDHLQSFSADPDVLRVVPALPLVLREGAYGGREPSHKVRRDRIVAFHTFTATVQIGERSVHVTVKVGEDARGNKFYALQVPKKKASGDRGDKSTGPKPSGDDDDGTTLYQSVVADEWDVNLELGQPQPEPAGIFYSRLTRAVEASQLAKASGAQWKATIKNAKTGISADEFAFAHVDDLAAATVYSKQEVLTYLAANAIVVEDVTLTENASHDTTELEEKTNQIFSRMVDDEIERLENQGYGGVDVRVSVDYNEDEDHWEVTIDGDDLGETFATEAEAEAAGETEAESRRESGDEAARDDLWETARANVSYDDAELEAVRELGPVDDSVQFAEYVEPGADRGSYREVFLTVPQLEDPTTGATQTWHDGHEQYDHIDSPIVRLRFNTRTVAGERILFLEEVQPPHEDQPLPALFRKHWRAIAMKWALRHAAEQGYPRVAWTTGAQQVARYPSIEKEVKRLRWGPVKEGTPNYAAAGRQYLVIETARGSSIRLLLDADGKILEGSQQEAWVGARLEHVIGKEIADKVAQNKGETFDAAALAEATARGRAVAIGSDGPGPEGSYYIVYDHGPRSAPFMSRRAASDASAEHNALLGRIDDETPEFTLAGEGLKFGGEGLRRLYDKDIPSVVNGLAAVKANGGRVAPLAMGLPSSRDLQYAGPTFTAAELRTRVSEDGRHNINATTAYELTQMADYMDAGGWSFVKAITDKGTARAAELLGGEFVQPTAPQSSIALTSAIRAAVLAGQPLFHGPTRERRGSIRFGPDQQILIRLLETADPSTLLHEFGHLFLKMFGDVDGALDALDPATLTTAQRQVRADYATILASFGIQFGRDITEAHHEQFARNFEGYLRTGIAPSRALRPAFARFRAWLVAVYESVAQLDLTLTPEVRAVFDRLLASDEAIKQAAADAGAAPLFTSAADAGMTDEYFAAYLAQIEAAQRTATEEVDRQLSADIVRQQTADWQRKRDAIEATVAAEVHARPVYRALWALQRGTLPDGSPIVEGVDPRPMPLSRDMLVNRWGWSRVKRLPAHPFVVTGEGGLDPEDAADLFGFSSGDALLTALEDVVTEPMQQVIGAETDRRMVAAEGEILTDGRLPDVAAVAVFNADRDAVIRTELQALETQRRTAPPTAAETHAAGERTPEEHAAAERAYERRWMEAEAKLRIAIAQGYQQVKIDALRATVRELKAAAVTARQERVYERRWFDAEAKLAAAQAAKASQAELAVLDAEVKQLRQRARSGAATIQKAMPSADALRQMALERIARTRVQDLDPRRYWMDARRAGQQAIAAAATQDFPAAIAAKQHELVNVTLFRVASQAKAEVEKRAAAAKALGSPASRARLALAGGGYQDQIDGVLDRYQFAKVSQKALDRRVALRLWIAGLESTGQTVTLPDDIIDDARRIHYRELTVEQLRGVTDGLTMLAHLATLKNTLLKAADKRAFEDLRDALADSIRTNNTARAKALEFPQGGEKWRAAADWFASHAKLSLFVSQLDGNVDGGPMWQAFARPINAAADQEEARNIATGKAYYALVDQFYPGREQLAFGELLHIPAIGASLTKEARLSVLQNWGTETGRDRVLSDPERQWTQPQIEAIIDTLDERDTQFVQAHWDFLQTFWPEIAAKQKRLTGLEPEKVETLEVTTKFGTLRGGYHPLMYDYRLNARAGQLAAAADAKQAVSAAYVQTTTKRGFVETRKTHVELPIRYELGVGIQHLGQVIHDLTHHEMLIDTTRLLRDSTIAKAILETRGDIVYGKLTRLLEDIALGDRARGGKATIAEKGANWLRSRSQVVGLAYNLWTSIQQPLGLFNGMDRVGVKWVARGAKRWLRDAASMENTLKWIVSVSPMMANRASSGNVDLRDVRQALREPGGWFDRLVRTVSADTITQQTIHDSYTYLIGAAQRIADVPTWLGEYEKQMHAHPGDEARAIALADQAVLDSQGGGQIKDLAEAQRGGPIAKLFMTYAAYSLTVLNASARAAGRTDFRSPASTLTFMGHVSLLYIMPALLTEILRCGVGRATCDDPLTFIEKVGGEILGTALNGVIYVREAASSVKVALNLDPGVRGYEGPAASRPFQILAQLAQQVRQHEVDGALEKAAFAAAGVIWRFPAAQVQRSVDGWIALQEDRTDNPLAVVFGPPPKRQAN